LLYAWGYIPDPCPDDNIYYAHATLMTQDNHYTYGPGSTTIYPTNGGSDDWMYGEQTSKPKTFAYTPELGGGNDGFWCPIDRIVPIAQENMIQNLLAAAFAGSYAHVEDLTPNITNSITGAFEFEITRLGLSDGEYTVSITPVGNGITSTGDPVNFANLDILESQTGIISYALDPAISNGTQFSFLLSVDNGSYVVTDTIHKIFGEAIVLFEDDCNTIDNWTSTFWGLTSSQYHSAPQSITDSPGGAYPNNANRVITLNSPVELNDAVYAQLNFWARWEIEAGYDYTQILISTDNGTTWIPLSGNYTVTGTQYQAEGEPLYDGFQTTWVNEEIDITQYVGNSVKFRYKLKADNGVTEDGFYFDDFTVYSVEYNPVGIHELQSRADQIVVSGPMPNPAKDFVTISYLCNPSAVNPQMIICNLSGQNVFNEKISTETDQITISLTDLQPGVYFYKIRDEEGFSSATKKIIVAN
jgi:hypothetical protein